MSSRVPGEAELQGPKSLTALWTLPGSVTEKHASTRGVCGLAHARGTRPAVALR